MPIAILAFLIPYFEAGEASLKRIFEVLDEKPEVDVRPNAKPIDNSKIKGKISFEGVSFGYRKKDGLPMALALKDINLNIEPGETVGFLGATGSGKSTLVNLLPRFYDVVDGRVTIDGIDVRDIPTKQLCEIIGIALQDAVLFSGTVRSNILFGRSDLDDDQMLKASKSAEADSFIDRIPEKYDSHVSRRARTFREVSARDFRLPGRLRATQGY